MKTAIIKLNISISIFLGTMLTLAQVVPPPPPEPESGDIGGPATPIDNYLLLLFLAAFYTIIYVNKKMRISKIS